MPEFSATGTMYAHAISELAKEKLKAAQQVEALALQILCLPIWKAEDMNDGFYIILLRCVFNCLVEILLLA